MKIVHLADTHLGYSAYRKITDAGFNQREEDVINAFSDTIDEVIKIHPDLVIHSGDLFDSVRPTNRILQKGIEILLRLYKNDIPLVIITGNHETPKQIYKGSVYAILDSLPFDKKVKDPATGQELSTKMFNVVYRETYEHFIFPGVTIHAIPQCSNDQQFRKELANLAKIERPKKSKHILMLHAGISDIDQFAHGESNELLIDVGWLNKMAFDYVALGHFHGRVRVTKNAWYAGSSERMSFNEVNENHKGGLLIDPESLDKNGEIKPENIDIEPRKMIDLPAIYADKKDAAQLMEEIETLINTTDPKDKIIRMTVKNIPQHVLNVLDTKKIRDLAKNAVHFEPRYEKLNEDGSAEDVKILSGGIREEFISFLSSTKNLSEKEKTEFIERWSSKINEIEKEEEEAKL